MLASYLYSRTATPVLAMQTSHESLFENSPNNLTLRTYGLLRKHIDTKPTSLISVTTRQTLKYTLERERENTQHIFTSDTKINNYKTRCFQYNSVLLDGPTAGAVGESTGNKYAPYKLPSNLE